jgi:glycosyltransferase involved in cell wall biosynthesis
VLGQSAPPLEVVVVDDGSTDRTAGVARSFGPPVRVVPQEARGIAAAVNHGVRKLRGDLVASVDADDLWPSGKLAVQLAALEARPDLDAVFGHAQNFRDGGGEIGGPIAARVRGTMLIRREALERVGPFTDWPVGEFIEWYGRAVDAGVATAMLPDLVLLRRVHESNVGLERRDERDAYARVLKSMLDRRRAGQP